MIYLAVASLAIPHNHPQRLILAPPNTFILWVSVVQEQGAPKHKEAQNLLVREIWGFA